jgi:tetratricopeptide (TPR) repeat protein
LERLRRFYEELRRRRMFRALGAYAVGAFAILQIAEPVVHGLHLPEWTITAIVVACAAGFPAAFALAWTYDLTGKGIQRTPDMIPTPRPPTPPAAAPPVKAGAMTALLEELAQAPEVAPREIRPLGPGDSIGRFEILREIGRGGFGVVYEARDGGLGRLVALKTVQPRRGVDPEMLRVEAEAAAQLQHPNIVTVHDVGTDGGHAWIVLELLRGETLDARLRRGPLPYAEALRVALGVARGLAHAHRMGIVHRDLKPANVFICEDGAAKILDFGLSRVFGSGGAEGGTPGYMAPEQSRGEPQDARTDVFAAAVMLYEMLSGQRPYGVVDGRSAALEAGRPPSVPVRAPAVLRRHLEAALHPDPARRPRDGGAWLEGLLRAEAARAKAGARPAMAVGVAGSTVAAIAIGFLVWRGMVGVEAEEDPGVRIPVAVADVRNGTSDPELDGLSGMLVTSLEQSRRLLVLTRSRLVDAIRQLGKEPPEVVDESLAREIGRSLGVRALLLATVHRFDQVYAIELRALDPATNEYLFTLKEQGNGKASVPELIDRLAQGTRERLRAGSGDAEGSRRAVAELTTPNLAAYERYFAARRAIDLRQFDVARKELEAALSADPNFALAHYARTVLDSWTHPLGLGGLDGPDAAGDRARLEAAVKLVDRLPERERLGLLAWKATADGRNEEARRLRDEAARAFPQDKDAVFWAGDQRYHAGDTAEAVPYFERSLALDPDYRLALEHIVGALSALGRYDDALVWARRWAETARTTESKFAVGRALVALDRFDEAQSMFHEAAGAAWDPPALVGWLARHGRLKEAEARARAAAAGPLPPGLAVEGALGHVKDPLQGSRAALENILVLQGRVREAERLSAVRLAKEPEKDRIAGHLGLAFVSRDLARARAALKEAEAAGLLTDMKVGPAAVAVLGLAGDHAGASALAPRVTAAPGWQKLSPAARRLLGGAMAYASGRPGEAEPALRETVAGPLVGPRYLATAVLGDLLVRDGRPAEAVELLGSINALPGQARLERPTYPVAAEEGDYGWIHPWTLLSLARAHESLGQRDEARACLRELLALWKDADADLPLLAEARALRRRLDGQKVASDSRPGMTPDARP